MSSSVSMVHWCNADHKFFSIGGLSVALEMGYFTMTMRILSAGVASMIMSFRILKITQTTICTNRLLTLNQNCLKKTRRWKQVWSQDVLKCTRTSCMLREIAWQNHFKLKEPSSSVPSYNSWSSWSHRSSPSFSGSSTSPSFLPYNFSVSSLSHLAWSTTGPATASSTKITMPVYL